MRYAFFFGGFVGFVVTGLVGFLANRAPEAVFRDAAIGCLAMAFLFRWFWSVLVRVFVETAHERRRKTDAAGSRREGATPLPSSPAPQP